MNRILLAIPFLLINLYSHSQNLLNKIPSNASVVIKYSGKNFSKNLPIKKIDSYNFVRNEFFKALKIDSLTSLQNTGIDFEQDSYQYISMEDTCMSFVTLFHIKDVSGFVRLLDANYHAEMKPGKRNGFEFLGLSGDSYIGWNNTQAVLVISKYEDHQYYHNYLADSISVVTTDPDEPIVIAPSMDEKVEVIPEAPVQKKKSIKPKPVQRNSNSKSRKNSKAPVKLKVPKEQPEEIYKEEVIISGDESQEGYSDSVAQAKMDQWYLEQGKKAKAIQQQVAGDIINNIFNGNVKSIETDITYKKVVDADADITVWFDYQNLLSRYSSTFFTGFGPGKMFGSLPLENNKKNDEAFRSGINVYFEKDNMRIEQRSFSPDEQMTSLGKDLFHSKQNPSLVKYVNPGNLGFLSMSINTEAMANYYYKLIKQYVNNNSYTAKYADIADVYIDLLEIIIDEKAIAELMPGNYMFVLHDMKTTTVSYTDYEYDTDFKYKEVKKTKQELSPNFTFVLETKKEGFMQKVINLPLKYAKSGNYNYQQRNGYYELVFDKGQFPLSNLYFMVKDGKLVITTSKESIDITLNNTGYTPDPDSKSSILNNNYSLRINSKALIQQISPELNAGTSKKISNYLQENIGNVKMESHVKSGVIQSTTTMAITGDHANSLEFFFNMIESINDIMEKEKSESEQKLN
ncbi:MAG: hypothetical protein ABIO04_13015 [Ferruginibacter sp.]